MVGKQDNKQKLKQECSDWVYRRGQCRCGAGTQSFYLGGFQLLTIESLEQPGPKTGPALGRELV